jgi:hypothetical protein
MFLFTRLSRLRVFRSASKEAGGERHGFEFRVISGEPFAKRLDAGGTWVDEIFVRYSNCRGILQCSRITRMAFELQFFRATFGPGPEAPMLDSGGSFGGRVLRQQDCVRAVRINYRERVMLIGGRRIKLPPPALAFCLSHSPQTFHLQ